MSQLIKVLLPWVLSQWLIQLYLLYLPFVQASSCSPGCITCNNSICSACSPNYSISNTGTCIYQQCESDLYYSQDEKRCVGICGEQQYLDVNSKSCVSVGSCSESYGSNSLNTIGSTGYSLIILSQTTIQDIPVTIITDSGYQTLHVFNSSDGSPIYELSLSDASVLMAVSLPYNAEGDKPYNKRVFGLLSTNVLIEWNLATNSQTDIASYSLSACQLSTQTNLFQLPSYSLLEDYTYTDTSTYGLVITCVDDNEVSLKIFAIGQSTALVLTRMDVQLLISGGFILAQNTNTFAASICLLQLSTQAALSCKIILENLSLTELAVSFQVLEYSQTIQVACILYDSTTILQYIFLNAANTVSSSTMKSITFNSKIISLQQASYPIKQACIQLALSIQCFALQDMVTQVVQYSITQTGSLTLSSYQISKRISDGSTRLTLLFSSGVVSSLYRLSTSPYTDAFLPETASSSTYSITIQNATSLLCLLDNCDYFFVFGVLLEKLQFQSSIMQSCYVVSAFFNSQSKQQHSGNINQLLVMQSSRILYSCSSDGHLKAWNLALHLRGIQLFSLHSLKNSQISSQLLTNRSPCIWVQANSANLLLVMYNNAVIVYNAITATVISTLLTLSSSYTHSVVQAQNLLFTLFLADGKLYLLDTATYSIQSTQTPPDTITSILATSATNRFILVSTTSNIIYAYDISGTVMSVTTSYTSTNQLIYVKMDLASYYTPTDEIVITDKSNYMKILAVTTLAELFSYKSALGYFTQAVSYTLRQMYIGTIYLSDTSITNRAMQVIIIRPTVTATSLFTLASADFQPYNSIIVDYKAAQKLFTVTGNILTYTSVLIPYTLNIANSYFAMGPLIFTPLQFQSAYSVIQPTTSSEPISLFGSTSGFVGAMTLPSNPIKAILLGSTTVSTIQSVIKSLTLSRYFVIHKHIEVYNIHTDLLEIQWKFDKYSTASADTQILQFIVSDTNLQFLLAVGCKAHELQLAKFTSKITTPVEYFSILFNTDSIIGIAVDETNLCLYVFTLTQVIQYDTSLSLLNSSDNLTSVNDGSLRYLEKCILSGEYIGCRRHKHFLFIQRATLKLKYSLYRSDSGFSFSISLKHQVIFIFSTYLQVYTFAGDLTNQITVFLGTITSLIDMESVIIIFDGSYNYAFSPSTFKLLTKIQGPGGASTLLGWKEITGTSDIAFYYNQITYGQVFYMSTSTLEQTGTNLNPYGSIGMVIGYVVELHFDVESNMTCFIDSRGAITNFLTTPLVKQFDNLMPIESFNLTSPKGLILDYETNNILTYNTTTLFKIDYNLFLKGHQRFVEIHRSNYFFLNGYFYIFDDTQALYQYKNYQLLQTGFVGDYVMNVYLLGSGSTNVIIVVVYENYFQIFESSKIGKIPLVAKYTSAISASQIRALITGSVYLTLDNNLVSFDFMNQVASSATPISLGSNYLLTIIVNISIDSTSSTTIDPSSKQYTPGSLTDIIIFGTHNGNLIVFFSESYVTSTLPLNSASYVKFISVVVKEKLILVFQENGDISAVQIDSTLKSLSITSYFNLFSISSYTTPTARTLGFAQFDAVYSRIFWSEADKKLARVFSVTVSSSYVISLSEITQLSFPDRSNLSIQFYDSHMLLITSAQINIHWRETLQFLCRIRLNLRSNQITNVQYYSQIQATTPEQQSAAVIISTLTTLLIYEVTFRTSTLLKLEYLVTPEVIQVSLLDEKRIFILGMSSNRIFEHNIQLSFLSSTKYQLAATCSKDITFSNIFQAVAAYSLIDEKIFSVIINMYVTQSLLSNSGIITNSTHQVITRPSDSSVSKDVAMIKGFSALALDSVMLDGYDMMILPDITIKFNAQTTKVIWQDLTFSSQNITKGQLLFANMDEVIFVNVTLDALFTNSSAITDSSSTQSFVLFNNVKKVLFQGVTVRSLDFSQPAILFNFVNVDEIVINDMQVMNLVIAQSLIEVNKATSLEISSSAFKNIITQSSITTAFPILSLVGVRSTTISSSIFESNYNLTLITSTNVFIEDNYKMTYINDTFDLNNVTFSKNTFPESDADQEDTILMLKGTTLTFNEVNSIENNGTFKVYSSTDVTIENSSFSDNLALQGGAVSLSDITGTVSLVKSLFKGNEATADGGALFLSNVNKLIFDTESVVTGNTALIGGGIRVTGTYNGGDLSRLRNLQGIDVNNQAEEMNTQYSLSPLSHRWLVLPNWSQNVYSNTAEIFGSNVGTYPSKVSVSSYTSVSDGYTMSFQAQSTTSSSSSYDQIDGVLAVNSFISGGTLQLNVSIWDNEENLINFDLSDNDYPRIITEEINKYQVELSSKTPLVITATGESVLSASSFSSLQKAFMFTNVIVTASPGSKAQLILYVTNLHGSYRRLIQLNISFRQCKIGEVTFSSSDSAAITSLQISAGPIDNPGFSAITSNGGSSAASALKICYACPSGKYSLEKDAVACKSCPSEAVSCEKDEIFLRNGYWRASAYSDLIFECSNNLNACRSEDYSESFNFNEGCAVGYKGPLCETCDIRNSIWPSSSSTSNDSPLRYTNTGSSQSYQCAQCSAVGVQVTYVILAILAGLVYILFSIRTFMNSFRFHACATYFRKMGFAPLSRSCMRDESSLYMKTLMNYFQLATILRAFSSSTSSKSAMSIAMKIIPVQLGQPGAEIVVNMNCIFPSELINSTTSDVGLLGVQYVSQTLLALFYCLTSGIALLLCAKYKILSITLRDVKFMGVFIFFFFHPNILRLSVSFFSCRSVGTSSYVDANMTIHCSDGQFHLLLYTIVIPLFMLWVICTPAFMLYGLYKSRNYLDGCLTKYNYGYFYLEFKHTHYFWDFIRLAVRTIVITIAALFRELKYLPSVVAILVFSVYISLTIKKKPFVNNDLQNVDIISYFVLILNLFCNVLQYTYESEAPEIIQAVIHLSYTMYLILFIIYSKINNAYLPGPMKSLKDQLLKIPYFSRIFEGRKKEFRTLLLWVKLKNNIIYLLHRKALTSAYRGDPDTMNLIKMKSVSYQGLSNLEESTDKQLLNKKQKMIEMLPVQGGTFLKKEKKLKMETSLEKFNLESSLARMNLDTNLEKLRKSSEFKIDLESGFLLRQSVDTPGGNNSISVSSSHHHDFKDILNSNSMVFFKDTTQPNSVTNAVLNKDNKDSPNLEESISKLVLSTNSPVKKKKRILNVSDNQKKLRIIPKHTYSLQIKKSESKIASEEIFPDMERNQEERESRLRHFSDSDKQPSPSMLMFQSASTKQFSGLLRSNEENNSTLILQSQKKREKSSKEDLEEKIQNYQKNRINVSEWKKNNQVSLEVNYLEPNKSKEEEERKCDQEGGDNDNDYNKDNKLVGIESDDSESEKTNID